MIRIIEISNAHQWDGVEVAEKIFEAIILSLTCSKFLHSIEYIDTDGQLTLMPLNMNAWRGL